MLFRSDIYEIRIALGPGRHQISYSLTFFNMMVEEREEEEEDDEVDADGRVI